MQIIPMVHRASVRAHVYFSLALDEPRVVPLEREIRIEVSIF